MEDQLKIDLFEDILRKGWKDVYCSDSSWSEDRRGEDETTTRTYVYKKGEKHFRCTWTRHQVIRPYKSYEDNRSWGEEIPITKADYDSDRAGKGQIDSAQNKQRLEKLKKKVQAERAKELAAHKAAEAAKPKCPKCGKKMVRRDGPHGKFWGCRQYPKCKGTRK